MQVREKLLSNYPKLTIEIDDELPSKLGGLYERYIDCPHGNIVLSGKIDYYIQNGHLAEEIGHHETSYGNITNAYRRQYNVDAARQELRARRYGHKLILPLERLIKCYEHGHWGDIYEMCLCLEIDRSHFKNIIDDYKSMFGHFVKYDGYRIQFEPLKIEKY